MTRFVLPLICFGFFILSTPLHAQKKIDWKRHTFKAYRVEFMTPNDWNIAINDSASQAYIECYSPDSQIYFFLTTADNEKKSEPEIILSFLKVTYANSDFIREEKQVINGIPFLFSSGINKMNEIQTYIKLGVGLHKNRVYMVDSGFNDVNSDDDEAILSTIIHSIKVLN